MPRKKKERITKILVPNPVVVRLDPKTIVYLKDIAALPFWRERYPNLTVLKDPNKKTQRKDKEYEIKPIAKNEEE